MAALESASSLIPPGMVVKQSKAFYDEKGELNSWEENYLAPRLRKVIIYASTKLTTGEWKKIGGLAYKNGVSMMPSFPIWRENKVSPNNGIEGVADSVEWLTCDTFAAERVKRAQALLKRLATLNVNRPDLAASALDTVNSLDRNAVLKAGRLEWRTASFLYRADVSAEGMITHGEAIEDRVKRIEVTNEIIPEFNFEPEAVAITVDGKQLWVIDASRRVLPLDKRHKFGMTLARFGSSYVVQGVLKGGPAEQAGVRVGYIVKTVNGVPISDLDNNSLQELFLEVTNVTMEVIHPNGEKDTLEVSANLH